MGGRAAAGVWIGLAALGATIGIDAAVGAGGPCWTTVHADPNIGAASFLGFSVVLGRDVLAAGAPDDPLGGPLTGAIVRYERTSVFWHPAQTLRLATPQNNDRLGERLGADAGTIVAGLPNRSQFRGAAAVFSQTDAGPFIEQTLLTAPDAVLFDLFGWSVGVGDGFIAVGAPGRDDKGQASGAVYLFTQSLAAELPGAPAPWHFAGKLVPNQLVTGDGFGTSISARGDLLAIGASGGVGSVYVYSIEVQTPSAPGSPAQATPTLLERIVAPAGAQHAGFGAAIAIDRALDDSVRLVAAASGASLDPGVVFVYERESSAATWTLAATLPGSAPNTRYGRSVAIAGDVLLIAEPRAAVPSSFGPGLNAGRVLRYQRAGGVWSPAEVWTNPNPFTPGGAGDEFGQSVAALGDEASVGAWLDDRAGNDAGAVFHYVGLIGLDCNQNGNPDACDIAFGCSRDTTGDRVPDDCEGRIFTPDITGPGLDGVPDGVVNTFDLIYFLNLWMDSSG